MDYWWIGQAPFNLENILGPFVSESRAQHKADRIGGQWEVEPFPARTKGEARIMFRARFDIKKGKG